MYSSSLQLETARVRAWSEVIRSTLPDLVLILNIVRMFVKHNKQFFIKYVVIKVIVIKIQVCKRSVGSRSGPSSLNPAKKYLDSEHVDYLPSP